MPWDAVLDLSEVAEAFDHVDDELRRFPAVAVRHAAEEGLAESKARRRYQDRTGLLTVLAYHRMLNATGLRADSEIGWPVPYASYVDAGTPAHTIRPRLGGDFVGPPAPGQRRTRGKGEAVLKFQVQGRWVSAHQVQHPGSKPFDFSGDASRKAESVLLREAEASIETIAKILGR